MGLMAWYQASSTTEVCPDLDMAMLSTRRCCECRELDTPCVVRANDGGSAAPYGERLGDRIGTVGPKEKDMFTGSRKTIMPGVLAGFAVLLGVGPTSASGRVVPAVPADTGVDLEWDTGAAPYYVSARWTGPTFAQFRGSGALYELRWGDGVQPVLVRIDAR
jgi:hypothetical protein